MASDWTGLPFEGHSQTLRDEKRRLARWAFWLFVTALVVQAAHVVEHVAQVVQWRAGSAHAHGLFGQHVDFVWFHFAFNAALLLLVGTIWGLWMRDRGIWRASPWGAAMFHGLILLESYHVVEHVAQVWQRYAMGMAEPPGLLGLMFLRVMLHFVMNAMVLGMMGMVFMRFCPKLTPFRRSDQCVVELVRGDAGNDA